MSGLLGSRSSIAGITLCSLMLVQETSVANALTMRKNLDDKEKESLQNLLHLYQDVFTPLAELPLNRLEDHIIPLKEGAQPVNLWPYRYYSLQKNTMERLISKMVGAGTIQPSHNPVASPVVIVKKKDLS